MKKLTSIILAVAIISSTFIFAIDKPLIAKAEDTIKIKYNNKENIEIEIKI